MHIDLNQFYAAASVLLEPELKGKPLIIAGESRRGIVSTASYEARKYGIHSAMPTYIAKKLCPNLVVRGPNFEFYHQKSNEFFSYIKENYTTKIEQASIDECYADMTDVMKDVKDPYLFLKKMQDDLFQKTGLQSSIGLSCNKFLAKMGSDYKKPMGITIIRKKDIPNILYPLKISDFYGIGKKTWPRLNDIGIYTIGDFVKNDSYELKKILGKFYHTAKLWIKGEGDDEVNSDPFDPKSISTTTTFMFDTNSYEEISQMLSYKAREVSTTAKKDKKLGKTITLILKDTDFKSITRSITLDRPTNEYIDIYDNVIKLFDKYYNGQLIRLAGVGLSSLINQNEYYEQISLFELERVQKECQTQLLINKLNRKANKELFTTASKLKKDK